MSYVMCYILPKRVTPHLQDICSDFSTIWYFVECFYPPYWENNVKHRKKVMCNGADGRAVQHLHSTATEHSTLIALHRSTISSHSHTLSQRWTTLSCSGARWWKGGHRGQSGGKMGLWRGRRSPDKTNSRDSKIGSPLQICSRRTKCTELLLSCI